jgi:hypothetical protein
MLRFRSLLENRWVKSSELLVPEALMAHRAHNCSNSILGGQDSLLKSPIAVTIFCRHDLSGKMTSKFAETFLQAAQKREPRRARLAYG